MEVFRVENITKQFSDKFVLKNFSFTIAQGDKVSISGKSGIGKTTFFRLLLGFEKPDDGRIFYNGELLTDDAVWDVRRKVAYVSQDLNIGRGQVRSLFFETLGYKANHHCRVDETEIARMLEFFELPAEFLDKNIEELSGGEKQRIAIVNALILGRKFFFLDEVTSALDVSLKSKVMDYFLLNPEWTVLFISHDKHLMDNAAVRTLKL